MFDTEIFKQIEKQNETLKKLWNKTENIYENIFYVL